MASISGIFTADGESAVLSGTTGNLDAAAKYVADAVGNVYIRVSYDGGTTWFALDGGDMSPRGGDKVVVAGSGDVKYKMIAKGVTGSIHYFLGAA